MSFELDKKYYIGKSEEGRWASVYAYKPKNSSIYLDKGEIFAVISLEGPKGFRAATAGNIILDYLHESYFEADLPSPLLCLENAIAKTATKLGEIVDRDTNLGDEGIDLNITALVVVDRIGYFVALGKGGIFLWREGNMVDVNQALKDPTGNGYIKSASTIVEAKDRFLLVTPQAISAYTKEELRESVENFDNRHLSEKPLEQEALLAFIMIADEHEANLHQSIITQAEEAQRQARDDKEDQEELEEGDESDYELSDDGSSLDSALPDGRHGRDDSLTKSKKELMEEDMVSDDDGDLNEDLEDDIEEVPKKGHVPHEPKDQDAKGLEVNYKQTNKFDKYFKQISKKIKGYKIGEKIKDKWEGLTPEGSDQTTFQYILNNIKVKAVTLGKFLYNLIWIKFLQMDQGIYLKNARRGTNWRLIGTLGVLVIVVLYLFINVNAANVERAKKIEEAKQTLSSVENQLGEIDPKITSILGVFDIYTRERASYQSALNTAKEEINSLEVVEEDEEKKNTLLSRIEQMVNKLDRKVTVENPTVLYDFAEKVDESVNLTDLEIQDGSVYVTDAKRGMIYSVDYAGGNFAEVVKGLTSPQSIVINDDGEMIAVDKSKTQPFFKVNRLTGAIDRLTGLAGQNLDSIIQIDDFKFNDANRLYFVKSGGTPVQYIGEVGAGYAGSFDRFTDTKFANSRDINVVDGKIYLLRPGEGAVRYLGDQQEQFNLYGLTSAELQNVINSTSFEVTGPFVIYGNSLGKSIVFTTKENGDNPAQSAFVAQVVIKDNPNNYLSDIKEIKVDFQTKDIFVLDGTRVLKFEYLPVERLNY